MLENGDNLNFIACLALHQQRRDSVLGLTHVTTKQRGLIWYYNIKQRELFTKFIQAGFYNSIIQAGTIETRRLVGKAHENPEKAVEILKQVKRLEVNVKKASKELKLLND